MGTKQHIATYSLADPAEARPVIEKTLEHLRRPENFYTALALYRRLQFGRFLEGSRLYTNRSLSEPRNHAEEQSGEPWFYAFVDRGCRPETEVWLFGNWEAEFDRSKQNHGITPNSSSDKDEAIQSLITFLIRTIKTHNAPPSIHKGEDVFTAQSQTSSSQHRQNHKPESSSLPDPNIMLWGAIHETTVPHLQALSLLASPTEPNWTFLFPLSSLPEPSPLPADLRWGRLEPRHFPLVRSRTEIPRQDFTLARLPNLGIFPAQPADAAPVAWAFVGLDGSLTTLHTEASHRRMGLGKLLSARLFREEMGRFWEDGLERLAHGNVMVGNEASAGMCRSLGGRRVAEVYWVRINLKKVE